MSSFIRPWHLSQLRWSAYLASSGAKIIECLVAENRILQAQIRDCKLQLNDDERCHLAALAKPLGRRILNEICSIVTPDTLLRWYRRLVARKYDGSLNRTPGRPGIMAEIRSLIVRVADGVSLAPPEFWEPPSKSPELLCFESPIGWRPRRTDAVAYRVKVDRRSRLNLYAEIG